MKKNLKLLLGLILFVVLLNQQALFVLAESGGGYPDSGGGGSPVGLPNPLRTDNIVDLLNAILRELITKIAPPILAIMILIGASQILFASGDPEKFEIGKKTIIYAVVGYTALLISWGIVSIIQEILSRGSR